MTNLPISRKLAVAFGAVLLTIAAMGAIIFHQLQTIEQVSDRRAVTNESAADMAGLEYAMVRQESSFRGFLATGDADFVERLARHGETFDATMADARDGASEEVSAQLDRIEAGMDAWREEVSGRGINLYADPASRAEALALIRPEGPSDAAIEEIEAAISLLQELKDAELATIRAETQTTSEAGQMVVLGGWASRSSCPSPWAGF